MGITLGSVLMTKGVAVMGAAVLVTVATELMATLLAVVTWPTLKSIMIKMTPNRFRLDLLQDSALFQLRQLGRGDDQRLLWLGRSGLDHPRDGDLEIGEIGNGDNGAWIDDGDWTGSIDNLNFGPVG